MPGGCASGAFELALGPDGQALGHGLRLLVYDGEPAGLGQLLQMAAASRWEVPARGASSNYVLLHLDCSGRSDGTSKEWTDLEASAQASLRARRRAAAHLRQLSAAAWSEHDLDCLWGNLETLRRGPVLYDDLEITAADAARVAAAAAADGGVWVGRAARHTHMGQLVILDRKLRLLAVARYILGE